MAEHCRTLNCPVAPKGRTGVPEVPEVPEVPPRSGRAQACSSPEEVGLQVVEEPSVKRQDQKVLENEHDPVDQLERQERKEETERDPDDSHQCHKEQECRQSDVLAFLPFLEESKRVPEVVQRGRKAKGQRT